MKTIKASLLAVLTLAAAASAPFSSAHARVVGITPDSEYLIFIVDSSGSMRRYEWDRVVETFEETLGMYPTVKGIQVMNDQGDHLLISYRGEWIPDTPANREWIVNELGNWEAYSTSNPRRALLQAIDQYYDPEKSIAIFLLSDDFSAGAGAIDGVVADVDTRMNVMRAAGAPEVRIHSVAFPVFYDVLGRDQFLNSTGADHAVLMSMLTQGNDGRLLALSSRHRAAAASAASPAASEPVDASNRVLIVLDTSAHMQEAYWQQAVDTVAWLFDEAGEGDSFQVVDLAAPTRSIVAGSEGQWLSNADGSLGERIVASLRALTPAGTVDLGAVPSVVRGLDPAPDRVYVLAASDPDVVGRNAPRVEIAESEDAPIDVLLFGAGDAPQSVPFYWSLALAGGGSLIAPEEDWP